MNSKQAIFRLQSYIDKDKQRISGYKLASLNSIGHKRSGYNSSIQKLEESILRKQEALEYLQKYYGGEVSIKKVSEKFHFSLYLS